MANRSTSHDLHIYISIGHRIRGREIVEAGRYDREIIMHMYLSSQQTESNSRGRFHRIPDLRLTDLTTRMTSSDSIGYLKRRLNRDRAVAALLRHQVYDDDPAGAPGMPKEQRSCLLISKHHVFVFLLSRRWCHSYLLPSSYVEAGTIQWVQHNEYHPVIVLSASVYPSYLRCLTDRLKSMLLSRQQP